MTEATLEGFRSRCEKAGFDVVHPFRVDAYNRGVDAPLKIADFGRSDALGILVGNSRFLWEIFVEALRREPSRLDDPHPLDRYAMDCITAAARSLDAPHRILWAHEIAPAPLPVQRIAHASGLAWTSPSHLSIHPVYGPWLGFRAVVVVERGGGSLESNPAWDPCTRCHKPCLDALDRAVSAGPTLDQGAVTSHFTLWRQVREACPEGSGQHYGEEQLRYHYIKDRELLRRAAR